MCQNCVKVHPEVLKILEKEKKPIKKLNKTIEKIEVKINKREINERVGSIKIKVDKILANIKKIESRDDLLTTCYAQARKGIVGNESFGQIKKEEKMAARQIKASHIEKVLYSILYTV